MLEELNQEWFSSTLSALETRRASLEQAGSSLSILGVAALFIILLSTLLIFTDLNKAAGTAGLEVARNRAEDLMKAGKTAPDRYPRHQGPAKRHHRVP